MLKQRLRHRQTLTLQERLSSEANRLREEAKSLRPCARRDHLMQKVEQLDRAAKIDEWLSSPGFSRRSASTSSPEHRLCLSSGYCTVRLWELKMLSACAAPTNMRYAPSTWWSR